MKVKVKSFYHVDTYTWTHLVICKKSNSAVLIDPVLDFCPNNAQTSTTFIDEIIDSIQTNNVDLQYILETHAHADHLTAAAYIQEKFNAKLLIGKGIVEVQKTFKKIFNFNHDFLTNGNQFDVLLDDSQDILFGESKMTAIHTPGHTNDSMSYIIDDNVFIGDTLFAPDYGSARCDFPGGDAGTLYDSVQKIYGLGNKKKLYLCHDYPVGERKPKAWFLSSQQQQQNIHIKLNSNKQEFIQIREARDKKLSAPKLIIPAIQINIAAGYMPKPEQNNISYLKVPLNIIGT